METKTVEPYEMKMVLYPYGPMNALRRDAALEMTCIVQHNEYDEPELICVRFGDAAVVLPDKLPPQFVRAILDEAGLRSEDTLSRAGRPRKEIDA